MLRPGYAISLGSTTLSSERHDPLTALVVQRAQNAAADSTVLTLGERPDLTLASGDSVEIELGWDGETSLVFSGEVAALERRIDGVTVTCHGSQSVLARTRTDQTFVRQSAGQVVSALAGDAGVDTATVQDGVRLPVYVADSGRSHYAHCLRLARWCGFGLYADEDGALVFKPFAAIAAAHTFRYGVDVISASVQRSAPAAPTAVIPESPASSQGEETASWLIKNAAPHAGGSGAATVSEPALRTKEAAATAAQARADRACGSAVRGHVQVAGAPAVALGDAVALDGMPDSALDETYEVRGLRHVLDRRRGFRTLLVLGGTP